jgi:hypothetical protein
MHTANGGDIVSAYEMQMQQANTRSICTDKAYSNAERKYPTRSLYHFSTHVIETLVGKLLVGLLIHKETILWIDRGVSFEKAILMVRVFHAAATLSITCARIE